MVKTPPIGELLLIKENVHTYGNLAFLKKGFTAIFVYSYFLGNLGEVFPILDPDGVECDLSVYRWKFIYGGELVDIHWYATIPIPNDVLVVKWEKFFEVIPKEEYKNYAL